MKVTGWLVGLAAIGVMLTHSAAEVMKLSDWSGMFTPSFVGSQLLHLGTVIGAFVGGKLIPTEKENV